MRSTVAPVLYRSIADGVVLLHLGFLLFVVLGGMLAWRWRPVVWAHVPAVIWSILSIAIGLDCPLTPLEKHFRRLAEGHSYQGGFIDRYIEGVIYPQRFTSVLRVLIALSVIVGYAGLIHRARATRTQGIPEASAAA